MELKGIFFDFYGTLLRYGDMQAAWGAWFDSFYRVLSGHIRGIERERLWHACRGLFSEAEPARVNDGLTVYERRLWRFVERQSLDCSVELVRRAAEETVMAWSRHVWLDPQALPMLEALRGRYRLALVSNFDHPPHIRSVLNETGLAMFFETVVISGDVGVKKPDPAILLLAVDAARLKPEEVVYVGDSREDMEAARDASMFGVWLEDTSNAVTAGTHYERHEAVLSGDDGSPRGIARATIRELRELTAVLERGSGTSDGPGCPRCRRI